MPYAFNEDQKAAVLAAWPGLAPSQLAALAARSATLGEATAAATSPADCVYYLQQCHVSKDASLVRPVPTAAEYVAHVTAQRKAAGLEVSALALAREAQEMSSDQLLAAVPHDAAALRASTTATAKKATAATYDPADQNQLVRAFAEAQGETYKAMLAEHGPGRLMAMAQSWHETRGRPVHSEVPRLYVAADTGNASKAKADAFAASPEAARMGPAERMTEYRRLLAG